METLNKEGEGLKQELDETRHTVKTLNNEIGKMTTNNHELVDGATKVNNENKKQSESLTHTILMLRQKLDDTLLDLNASR